MKLKKLLHKYVPFNARLLIKVVDGVNAKELISTDVHGVYDEHTDLLNCKVLQFEANKGALCIIVEERSA